MSTLPRFGSSSRLKNLARVDTSPAVGASTASTAALASTTEPKRTETSPQTSLSAPVERPKYQLWPALGNGVQDSTPQGPEPAALPTNRSVGVHQSAEQMWLIYGRGNDPRTARIMQSSKQTQASPTLSQQSMLDLGT